MVAGCLSIGSLGLPLPSLVPAKEAQERFPCENCPCGCATAEQCWNDCCCHSPQQRLKWAVANGVQPPASFVEELLARGVDVNAVVSGQQPAAVCEASVGATEVGCCCCAKQPAPRQKSGKRLPGVQILAKMKCNGMSVEMLGVSVGPLPPMMAIIDVEPPPTGVWSTPVLYLAISEAPTPPPPEALG